MSRSARLALTAALCAGLAGVLAFSATDRVDREAGPSVRALMASSALAAGTAIDSIEGDELVVREIPARYAPPDLLSDPAEAAGARLRSDLPQGSYLTRSLLSGGAGAARAFRLRGGERAVTVEVIVSPAGHEFSAGDRVDIYASGLAGSQRTDELVAGAEVLAVDGEAGGPRPRVTVRLAAGQVSAVIRGDVFARELRAVLVSR